MNTPLPKALLSILLVIGGYFAIAYTIRPVLDGIAILGYEVDWSVWTSSILTVLVIGWVAIRRGEVASLGLSRPKSFWKGTLLGIIATAGVYLAIVLPAFALMSAGIIQPPEQTSSAMLVSGPSLAISIIFTLIVMWINAAFGEELLFRGFLMNNLQRALGDGWVSGIAAALIIAVFFGVMHVPSQGLYGLVITGLAGFGLGITFLIAKRNLYPVVLAHGLINSFSIFMEVSATTT